MINVLAVDDSVYSIEGIKCAIDWSALGVSELFTAFNAEQAKKVMQQERIDILITDIEMPHGNGFDLLRWMREHGYDPVVIILTSYGVFQYAKQAVEFECIDYLLKPVSPKDLQNAVQKGIKLCITRQCADENRRLAQLWNAESQRRARHFWRDILDLSEAPDSAAVIALAAQANIAISAETVFLPLLFKMISGAGAEPDEETVLDFAQYLQLRVFEHESIVVNKKLPFVWAVLRPERENPDEFYTSVLKKCRTLIEYIREERGLRISCYVGEFCDAGGVPRQLHSFDAAAREDVVGRSGLLFVNDRGGERDYIRPDIERWSAAILSGGHNEAVMEIDAYLDALESSGAVSRSYLRRFFQDYMQAFYTALSEMDVQAQLLFSDSHSERLHENACNTIADLKKWIHHTVAKAKDLFSGSMDENSVVANIKRYIKENLTENLNRGTLSGVFYLSSDYLSRIFKKETGMQLTEYITEVRMEEARRLLLTTDLPISDVANLSGYYNIAYFSKTFRIRNGMTPMQFRETKAHK